MLARLGMPRCMRLEVHPRGSARSKSTLPARVERVTNSIELSNGLAVHQPALKRRSRAWRHSSAPAFYSGELMPILIKPSKEDLAPALPQVAGRRSWEQNGPYK